MSLVASINDALHLADRHTADAAVHDLVRNALRAVAPGVEVRTTDYFTHTFVPDLVLAWGPNDRRQQRHVHLRFEVSDQAFVEEIDYLASTEPLFLGLLDSQPITPGLTNGSLGADGRAGTLVTQSAAIEALDEGKTADQRTVTATRELVRGGRGTVDTARATAIVDGYHGTLQAIETLDERPTHAQQRTAEALVLLQEVLRPRHFATVERDLRSRWIRSGGDPFQFPGASEWDPQTLSHEELGEVLNSLLDSGRVLTADTWTNNAWFLSAQELAEVLATDRRGGTLNHLAAALLPNWTAQWVWAERLDVPLQESYDWLIAGETLGIEIGDIRVWFRDDGRRFKDKKPTEDPLPTIEDMAATLSDQNVLAASFRTPTEEVTHRFRTGVGQSIYERVRELFAPSQRDQLRVDAVTTVVPGREDSAEIELERQVIDLDKKPTPITVLIRLAVSYFGRAGYDYTRVEQFLRSGEQAGRPVEPDAGESDQAM